MFLVYLLVTLSMMALSSGLNREKRFEFGFVKEMPNHLENSIKNKSNVISILWESFQDFLLEQHRPTDQYENDYKQLNFLFHEWLQREIFKIQIEVNEILKRKIAMSKFWSL